jgi:hypothetical protein
LGRIPVFIEVKPSCNNIGNTARLIVAATEQFIKDIDYNAKGQRELIEYGNGVTTTYTYDRNTFRLTHLQTLRGGDESVEKLQDLFYIYDPIGNIVSIRDDAQQTIFFNGQAISQMLNTPMTQYTA